jgi:hypothetical protein
MPSDCSPLWVGTKHGPTALLCLWTGAFALFGETYNNLEMPPAVASPVSNHLRVRNQAEGEELSHVL